ncbi:zinc finger protein 135-like [Cheilinus undulatus]|uniref:zinc finger protein 135-like n=1 Tax=Cheilinus undulatus TaxID=241271 RepID=UPI001BD3B614|nr:zinc finger protein 135-like [Cheilinus undulatus]
MSKVSGLRAFVNQRLSEAAEEIFGLYERTIEEYEEQLRRSKEENERQQKRLDALLSPQLYIQGAGDQQLSCTEQVPPEQQEWSPGLEQEVTEPPHIKEEQEELWSSQEGGREVYPVKFPFSLVSVKSEDDEEKPHFNQLHEMQTEELKAEADEGDCGGSQKARNLHPETENKIDDSSGAETDARRDTTEHQPDSGNFENTRSNIDKISHSSPGGVTSESEGRVIKHMGITQREKPFSCHQCGKQFLDKGHLTRHMSIHTDEKGFSCSYCGERFEQKMSMIKHMILHTGGKPYSCSECGVRFIHKSKLTRHMLIHTGEKPFSCSQCDKSFKNRSGLVTHMLVHTGEILFNCFVCNKGFKYKSSLNSHLLVHTGEKPFSCSECDKRFKKKSHLIAHRTVHSGEKPFSCSECGKRFGQKGTLTAHIKRHRSRETLQL